MEGWKGAKDYFSGNKTSKSRLRLNKSNQVYVCYAKHVEHINTTYGTVSVTFESAIGRNTENKF